MKNRIRRRWRLRLPALAVWIAGSLAFADDSVAPEATNAAPSAVSPAALDTNGIGELKRQAEKGDADAEQKLGAAYYNGQIVAQDLPQAFDWAQKSAAQGNTTAEFNLAYYYLNGYGTEKNPAKAFEWYLKLANRGVAAAQYCVAELYANGNGVTRDYPQAVAWYRKAADQGDPSAELAMGNAYFRGVTVPKDEKTAFDWFSKAADHGSTTAQLAMGEAYAHGIGTEKDEAKAVDWYKKAAIAGNDVATVRFGVACLTGAGTPRDEKKGFTYLLSVSHINGDASYWIARCYRDGLFVSRDPVQAYAWALHAQEKPHSAELDQLLAELKAVLTPKQIGQAEKTVPEITKMLASYIEPADLVCDFANGKSTLIHYEDADGLILIPVKTADQSPAYLMFDTGANAPFLSDDFAAKIGVDGNSYLSMSGIGTDVDLGLVSRSTDIAIPGLTLRNSRWMIDRGATAVMAGNTGWPVVGVLGLVLCKDLVVRIDFAKQTIEFIRPDSFTPPASGFTSLPVTVSNLHPMTPAMVINRGVEAPGQFLVDTGNTGSISLAKIFQDRHPSLKIEPLETNGASGFGGILRSSTGSCSSLLLGNVELPKPQVDLNAATQGGLPGIDGGIGTAIWRRFTVTLDFPHQKIYLQKNAHFNDPYNYVTAGMHVVASGENYGTLTVHEILPGSPAAQAGFQSGDVIVKIDEVGSEPLTLGKVYPLIHTSGTYHFQIRRDGQVVPVVLELRDPHARGPDVGK